MSDMSPHLRSALRIAIPTLVILIGTIATVVVALDRMAGEVNRTENVLRKRSAEAAVQSVLQRIGQTHQDYAQWDDAVRRLYGRLDEVFVRETFLASTETGALFDTAFILNEDRIPVLGIHGGRIISGSLRQAFSEMITQLMVGLEDDGRTYAVKTGFVESKWGLAATAVGSIVPTSDNAELRHERSRYLVLARSFDKDAVDAIGSQYVLEGLRFAEVGEEPDNRVPISDPNGGTLALLTWPDGGLGSEAHNDVSPAVMLMLALIGVTVMALTGMVIRGVEEIRKSAAQAEHSASYDSLSGLFNRRALIHELEGVISRSNSKKGGAAVLFMDLDGFKRVNDTYGHDIGDELLRRLSADFRSICQDRVVGRVGGDEFSIIVTGDDPLRCASDLGHALITYLSQPIEISGRTVAVGTSIGIALIDDSIFSPEEALRRADIAMYQAKQKGRNRIFVYDPALDEARDERVAIAADLRAALRSNALEIVYQPIFDTADRHVIGAEALLRWTRSGHTLPPSLFIPVAEEIGLIDELGAWTLRQACQDAIDWPNVRLGVNVSPAQLLSPNFELLVSKILSETGFQSKRLELEITESYLVANPTEARRSIDAIRALGVSVALDDFGTGYSSIGYLRRFSFDRLKLDRSMIVGIDQNQGAQRLMQATIALADALGLEVTAEGVESEEEAILLHLAGCQELQGFFLSRPISAATFGDLLQQDRLVHAEGAKESA